MTSTATFTRATDFEPDSASGVTQTRSAWDSFVRNTVGGHHVQTTQWATLKQSMGWQSDVLTVEREGQIVAGAQVLHRKLFAGLRFALVAKAPLLKQTDPLALRDLLRKMRRLAWRRRIVFFVVQPSDSSLAMQPALERAGYVPTLINYMPLATVVVDLQADLDTILARMRKKTRYCVRRGLREGITVRRGNSADIATFYALHSATAERIGFRPFDISYYEQMWQLFHPDGAVQLFIAEYEGTPISANWVVAFGDTVLAKRGGWSGELGRLRPNEVMDWETIRWAKANGYRYYDLEGIDIDAARVVARGEALPQSLQQSSASFKLGYGGDVVFYPQPFVYMPFGLRGLYGRAAKLMQSPLAHRLLDLIRTG